MLSDQKPVSLTLFGAARPWRPEDWTASDDRVRGGKSQSYLECSDDVARFHGTLDIKTLGGAGFASQRTTTTDCQWDLRAYAGIQLNIEKGDKKRYTFNLKDELLPPNEENGREQSTLSWEVDFDLPPQTIPGETHNRRIFIPWSAFTPTYRGRVQKDARPLNTASIKRFSIMMRSFFGTQEGDFSLIIRSIEALSRTPEPDRSLIVTGGEDLEKGQVVLPTSRGVRGYSRHIGILAVAAVAVFMSCTLVRWLVSV